MAARGATARLAQAVKPHVPLIKFRGQKAQGTPKFTAHQDTRIQQPIIRIPRQASSFIVKGTSVRGSGIDHRHLPSKYRQRQLTDEEIEIVERGGFDM
ncbi:alpha-ketoglutarate dehydrogenase component 4-like [Glandiceps talaboti]